MTMVVTQVIVKEGKQKWTFPYIVELLNNHLDKYKIRSILSL